MSDRYQVMVAREPNRHERVEISIVNGRCNDPITMQRVWDMLVSAGYHEGKYSEATIKSSDPLDWWEVDLCMIDAIDQQGMLRRFTYLRGVKGTRFASILAVDVTDEELEQQIKANQVNYTIDEAGEDNPFV